MRYLLICFLLFFISANSLFAQESIGFSETDSLQPLLDYRLPDWGYSNFYVDFDAIGNGFDQKTDSDQEVQKSGNFGLAPAYNLYKESEQRIFRINTRMDLFYNRQVDKSSDIPVGTNIKTAELDLRPFLISPQVSGNIVQSNHFFMVKGRRT